MSVTNFPFVNRYAGPTDAAADSGSGTITDGGYQGQIEMRATSTSPSRQRCV